MGAILGIDVGRVRVGLAVTDSNRTLVSPLSTVARAGGVAEQAVKNLVEERKIELFVVGMPLSASGERTAQCEDIERFCRRLERRISVPIEFIDEHLTSEAAKERIIEQKGRFDPKRDRELLDAYAAVIIVEDYLRLKKK